MVVEIFENYFVEKYRSSQSKEFVAIINAYFKKS